MLRLEDLGLSDIKVYQDDSLYTFTSDSVLLAKFANVKMGDNVADFCAGSGIVGFYLYALNSDKVKAVIAGKEVKKVIVIKGRLVNIIA